MAPNKKKIIVALSVVIIVLAIVFIVFSLLSKNKSSLPAPVQKTVEKVETMLNIPPQTKNIIKPTTAPISNNSVVPAFPTVTPTPDQNTLHAIENTPTPIPTLKPATPNSVETDVYLSMSNSVSGWLSQMRTGSGVYYFMSSCEESGQCSNEGPDNRASAPIIWSRFKLYQKTQNPLLLKEIEKDFTIYNNPSIVQLLQVDFWNCKFLYELSQSTALTQIYKLHAKNLCERGQYFPTDVDEFTESIKKNAIQEADLNSTRKGVPFTSTLKITDTEFGRYSANSSDFSAKYQWFKKADDLAFAKMFFTKAALSYISLKNQKTNINDTRPLLGIAAIDIYSATKDSTYLDFAKYIATEQANYGCESLTSCSNYAMLLDQLYKETKDQSYNTKEYEMLASTISQGYDLSGFPAYKKGTGAFRTFNPGPYQFISWQNGYLSGILAGFSKK